LTRIYFLAIFYEVKANDIVTVAISPSGIFPTRIPIPKETFDIASFPIINPKQKKQAPVIMAIKAIK
jgi:hypothetical protein